MEAVLRNRNLFKKFLLKVISSQLQRFNLTVSQRSIINKCYWVYNGAHGSRLESLKSVALCIGQTLMPYHTATFDD